jgi:hypothetical protein
MNVKEAESFCGSWLPAWTGNTPETLIQFYAHNAFYLDSSNKQGLKGHNEILPYFIKLLKNNPNWIWTHEEIFPTDDGFALKWKAVIPVRNSNVIEYGMDIVTIADGKITRNEVYFDTLTLLNAIRKK